MKRTLKLSACTLVLLLPSWGHAENTLKLDEGIKLLAINGKEVSSNHSFFLAKGRYTLPDGTNQILVSYSTEIKNGSSYELEETDPSVITFTESGRQLTIGAPPLSTERQVTVFNKQLNWRLTTPDNTPIRYKATRLPLQGLRLGINYERELREFNRTSNAAAIPMTESPLLPIEASQVLDSEQTVILKMLQHWYKLASPETREKFKSSL
ncbi:YccT family protein [Sedimenticola sp.]|uniref:YccT family protein n=1 Tax=Sedimenticola sp. TaxID=1940285 RepID=UPI003D0FBE8E